jgi:large subunit ribosomal protein L17
MVNNMTVSVILYEKVKTTQAKAKLVKPVIESLIATAKRQDAVTATRTLNAQLPDKNATKKVMRELLERYKDRSSGFVRLTPLGNRPGDAAPVVQIELV